MTHHPMHFELTVWFYSIKRQESWADYLPRTHDAQRLIEHLGGTKSWWVTPDEEPETFPVITPQRVVVRSEVIDALIEPIEWLMTTTLCKGFKLIALDSPDDP